MQKEQIVKRVGRGDIPQKALRLVEVMAVRLQGEGLSANEAWRQAAQSYYDNVHCRAGLTVHVSPDEVMRRITEAGGSRATLEVVWTPGVGTSVRIVDSDAPNVVVEWCEGGASGVAPVFAHGARVLN